MDAEGRLSFLIILLDVADLERGFPASGGEGRPGDDRRLAFNDDRSVVGLAIVEHEGLDDVGEVWGNEDFRVGGGREGHS